MTDFNNFWYTEACGNVAWNDYKLAHLTFELSLHYLVKCKNRVFKHIEASIWNVWRCNLQNFGLQILIPSRAVRTTRLNKQTDFIFFIDEKVFTVAPLMNAQNDRVYAPRLTKKRNVSSARFLRTRSTFTVGFITVACLNEKYGQFLVFLKNSLRSLFE